MWYNFLILIPVLAWGKGKDNNNQKRRMLKKICWQIIETALVSSLQFYGCHCRFFHLYYKRIFARRIIKLFERYRRNQGGST